MDHHNNHSHTVSASKAKSSPIKWLGICIGLAAVAILAIRAFQIPVNTVVFGAVLLACPLMHLWMMRNGEHKH